jgi:hypothetical protein
MGRWKGATFKEYIREELACYMAGMMKNMKQNFKFVYVLGNSYHDVTATCIEEDSNLNCVAAAYRNHWPTLIVILNDTGWRGVHIWSKGVINER